ncbi:MAG TPA: hypothetical protein VGL47_40390 [Amycolatopsis sp.]|uniref:hypothetical protein n=1 Tax=Amycolatopsis sp. TaxID=37632 RepID=UPI002F42BD00
MALLVHAIGYTTSGKCGKFWSVAQLSLPTGTVGVVNRFDFLRRIWLYTWLRRCATAAVVSAMLTTTSKLISLTGPAPASPLNTPEFTTEDGYGLLVAAGFAVALVAKGLVERAIAVALPDAHLAVAVHRCFDSEEHHWRPERIKRRAGIIDLLGERRVLLARAA